MTGVQKLLVKIISLVIITVIITLFTTSFILAKRDENIYPSNIWVGETSLGNLSKEEAAKLIENRLAADWGRNLVLVLPQETVNLSLAAWGISYDYPGTCAKVEALLDNKKGFKGWLQPILIRGEKQQLTPCFNLDKTAVYHNLLQLKQQKDKPAVDARILYNNDYLNYISHRSGYAIDINTTLSHITEALGNGQLGPIQVAIMETSPRVKIEDIKTVKDILGISAVPIKLTSPEIDCLVEHLNGLIIMPNEVFSFQGADILINPLDSDWISDLSPACLGTVESIINKTWQQAGLETADEGYLRFKNNLQHPVLMTTEVKGNSIIIKIFGCQTQDGKQVQMLVEEEAVLPQVTIIKDYRLPPGQRKVKQEGENGVIKRYLRVITSNGREVEKSLLAQEFVPALDTIVVEGIGLDK